MADCCGQMVDKVVRSSSSSRLCQDRSKAVLLLYTVAGCKMQSAADCKLNRVPAAVALVDSEWQT
jgi:hypothetical protein